MKTKSFLHACAVLASIGPVTAQQQVTSVATTPAVNTPSFLWYPSLNAVRIGTVDTAHLNYWNPNSWPEGVGAYSFSAGRNARAACEFSFAFGDNAFANTEHGIAIGSHSYAVGEVAIGAYARASAGQTTAVGYGAHALGYGSASFAGYASGEESVAVGRAAQATGESAIALATYAPYDSLSSIADGNRSIIVGYGVEAHGDSSLAMTTGATADADYSIALGSFAQATSFGGVAIGMGATADRMSGAGVNPSTPHVDDPVFVVSQANVSDAETPTAPNAAALVIYRNGASHFNGTVRVRPSGDISMGSFTSTPGGVQFPAPPAGI